MSLKIARFLTDFCDGIFIRKQHDNFESNVGIIQMYHTFKLASVLLINALFSWQASIGSMNVWCTIAFHLAFHCNENFAILTHVQYVGNQCSCNTRSENVIEFLLVNSTVWIQLSNRPTKASENVAELETERYSGPTAIWVNLIHGTSLPVDEGTLRNNPWLVVLL